MASLITFGRVIHSTATVTYDFSDFTEVVVFSVFSVVVTQSTEFSVKVNIDADIVHNLDVTQVGSSVRIGPLTRLWPVPRRGFS